MSQMKEHKKSPEKELNEMEATKIPGEDFKTRVIQMLKDLRGRMDDLSENINKERVSTKKDMETIEEKQPEIKNMVSEMKNTLEGINSRFEEAED